MVKCPREKEKMSSQVIRNLVWSICSGHSHDSGQNWRFGVGHTASLPSSAISWASAVKWGDTRSLAPGGLKDTIQHPALSSLHGVAGMDVRLPWAEHIRNEEMGP